MQATEMLLDRVYAVLRKRGEDIEVISSTDAPSKRTGIAYIPYDVVTPVSFLYTATEKPLTLVIDVLFATHVPEHNRVEVSVILNELNSDQTAGAFQLDAMSGYVYYRQSFVVEGLELNDTQFAQLMRNIESVAIDTATVYADVMENSFPKE